jgi:hypothetical protein
LAQDQPVGTGPGADQMQCGLAAPLAS